MVEWGFSVSLYSTTLFNLKYCSRVLWVVNHWVETSWEKYTLYFLVGSSWIIFSIVAVSWSDLFTLFKTAWTQVIMDLRLPVGCCFTRIEREGGSVSCTWPPLLVSNVPTPAFETRLIMRAIQTMRYFVALNWVNRPPRALPIIWSFKCCCWSHITVNWCYQSLPKYCGHGRIS